MLEIGLPVVALTGRAKTELDPCNDCNDDREVDDLYATSANVNGPLLNLEVLREVVDMTNAHSVEKMGLAYFKV